MGLASFTSELCCFLVIDSLWHWHEWGIIGCGFLVFLGTLYSSVVAQDVSEGINIPKTALKAFVMEEAII